MLRLIFSFMIALVSHFYIFQYNFNIDNAVAPQLVSDSSVTVSLNQNLKKQTNTSTQESIQKEKVLSEVPLHQLTDSKSPEKPKNQALPSVTSKSCKTKKKKKELKTPRVAKEVNLQEQKTSLQKKSNSFFTPVSAKKPNSRADSKLSSQPTTSSVIKARPLYQYNPKPVYPSLARRRGWEGIVILLVEVTNKGEVSSIQIHESCGYKILDKAALKSVSTWCFIPGTNNGKVVSSAIMIPVHFKLH